MKIAIHPIYGAPRPRIILVPRGQPFPVRVVRPLRRGFGATVATSGTFGAVVDPTTYLTNVITQLNAQGGNTPASVMATLNAALTNNYCTPENPSPACHDPAAAAALVSQLSATAKTGTPPAPSGGQFGFQAPSAMPAYAPAPLSVYRPVSSLLSSAPSGAASGSSSAPPPASNYVTTDSSGSAPAPSATSGSSGQPSPAAVATGNWLTDSMIGGVPNWVLLAVAGSALFIMGGKR